VSTGTAKTITTPGTLPVSSPVTLTSAGTYYWQASYSGDTNNAASKSTCGTSGEVETVQVTPPPPTTVATSLSGGGKIGSSITVPTSTAVTDSATLSGTNASTATGSITYDAYSNATCTTAVSTGTAKTITTPGTLPVSSPVTLTSAGTYYWQASYSGDTNDAASKSTCGTSGEVETVTTPNMTHRTSVTTVLVGSGTFGGGRCWWLGDFLTVFKGASVTDSATLSGVNAPSAGGTVTYTVYSYDFWGFWGFGHKTAVASGGTVTVTNGSVPNSNPVTLAPGLYVWQASYSGDALNAPSTSQWDSEIEYVVPVPSCKFGWSYGFDGGCRSQGNGDGNGNWW
jgi:hypothetical protein